MINPILSKDEETRPMRHDVYDNGTELVLSHNISPRLSIKKVCAIGSWTPFDSSDPGM